MALTMNVKLHHVRHVDLLLLVSMTAFTLLSRAHGYVLCPTPVKSAHGGYNVTVPPNQPIFSNGTNLYYFCDAHYEFAGGFTVSPVTCSDTGVWKLYGMNTNCIAENCRKPIISKGSGVTVVGTNYSQGAMIRYECKTGWSTLEPTAICLGPDWSNKYNPWCRVETCLDLTFGQNSSTVPYGRLKVTNLGQYDPLSPDLSWRVQQYQAQFRYSCDAGTKLLGTAVRTCNATGMWSGNRPFCFVQDHQCYANTKCADGKVCCEWGGIGAVGLNCCKPTTKLFIGERFSNLSRPCFKDLEDDYFPCMTQIIKCIDDDDDQDRCLTEWVLPDYLYGCSSNLGDKVPQYRGSSTSDQDLVEFCKRDQRTVACTELQTTYDSYTVNAVALRARTCLPRTCASDPAADLRALAESTLKLRCHVQKRTSYYCTIYSVTLNCSNGLQATARQEDGACAQCPPPGGDPKLTKCCTYNGKRIGCCLPKVQTILSEQAEPIDSPACRNSVLAAMTPCVRLIADCLNSLAGTTGDYICPSYHNCNSNRQTASQCSTYYAGSKNSLWCQTSCEFPGDPARSCQSDNFCLEQTCNTTTDLEQLAYSDARLICDYTKLANNVENCDRVKVTWFCSHGSDQSGGPGRTVTAEYKDPSNSTISILPTKPPQHSHTVGLAVGLSVGIVVFLLVIVAIGFFVIRPRLKANPWRNLEGPDSTLVYKDEDC